MVLKASYLALLLPLTAAMQSRSQAPQLAAPQPSTLLRPGLNSLEPALETLQPARWKLPQPARDEVQANLGSLHRALETTLPTLLTTADAAPSNFPALLPLSRNITALYDVLLRVEERARTAAPADQFAAVGQARLALDQARRAFDASLETTAIAQQAQLQQLQTRLATPTPVCPAPPATKKGKPRTSHLSR